MPKFYFQEMQLGDDRQKLYIEDASHIIRIVFFPLGVIPWFKKKNYFVLSNDTHKLCHVFLNFGNIFYRMVLYTLLNITK
jgi:hypothetical protein